MTALAGLTVAISISDAPDRAKLGFPVREVERALFTLCTALIRAGARIQYAGDLRPGGWTFRLFQHLAGAYAGSHAPPFLHVIPEPVFRRESFDALVDAARQGRGVADAAVVIGARLWPLYLQDGALLFDPRAERVRVTDAAALAAWLDGFEEEDRASAFSRARRLANGMADARVAMGGKLGLVDSAGDKYEGTMPGIAEEVIMALEAGAAVAPLGAFGGATRDVAIALGLLPPTARVPRGPQQRGYEPAMIRLAELRSVVPESLLSSLRAIADSDQAEWIAQEVVQVVAAWPRSSRPERDAQSRPG